MASWGKCDFSEFKKFCKDMEQLEKEQKAFCEACAKEVAARLLRLVIKETPKGGTRSHMEVIKDEDGKAVTYKRNGKVHKKGEKKKRKVTSYMGGTLRRGWTSATEKEALNGTGKGKDVTTYVAGMRVTKRGGNYEIVVMNPVYYASYVEYGHRLRLGKKPNKGWVPGKFMMTASAMKVDAAMPKIIEKKLKLWLEAKINGK